MVWKPGESGNPNGRPKRKPITDALIRELAAAAKSGGTNADRAAQHLIRLMFSRNPKVALEAAKLVLAYTEGLPVQPVDLEIRRAAEEIAARTGADPDWLVKRAQEIAREAERVEA